MTKTKITSSPESAFYEPLDPGLYIVATPIGNLGDITMRAVDVLKRCDAIACEDTRVTAKLMGHLGLQNQLLRYDDHASKDQRDRLLERAQREAIALVSDAGTPLISDPGYRLVSEACEAEVAIIPVPGVSAAIAGLTISGLPTDRFTFAGFLPVKDKAKRDMLGKLSSINGTLIFYETGPRLVRSLEMLATLWPLRGVAVARELTKLHEECRTGTAQELATHYSNNPPKGEIVLMVGPPVGEEADHDPEALLLEALADLSPSKAAAKVAKATGLDRQTLYARAVELKS
ncbi:MAG: 16S rRNA (cytidine(1402)-2'-O)-methyltransferase [Pseudomonadota bacterium]